MHAPPQSIGLTTAAPIKRKRGMQDSGEKPRQSPLDVWDLLIDELDRQGQAGNAADVLVPATLHPDAPSGRRFGQLTRVEIDSLAAIGGRLGRRGDIIKDIWTRTQQKIKAQARTAAQRTRTPRDEI
jgi:hypothetical protein